MGYSRFWLKKADVESKSIPNELPSSHWLKATGQCVLERYLSATMSVQEDKCPTQASTKADMQAWLTKHIVAWSNDMLKVELLELCRTHRPLSTLYH